MAVVIATQINKKRRNEISQAFLWYDQLVKTDSTKQQINLILRRADLKRTNLSIATFVWGALARL